MCYPRRLIVTFKNVKQGTENAETDLTGGAGGWMLDAGATSSNTDDRAGRR